MAFTVPAVNDIVQTTAQCHGIIVTRQLRVLVQQALVANHDLSKEEYIDRLCDAFDAYEEMYFPTHGFRLRKCQIC